MQGYSRGEASRRSITSGDASCRVATRAGVDICDVMEGVLDKCLNPTTEMIANLIEIENAHINTNHPDFVGSADSMLNLF